MICTLLLTGAVSAKDRPTPSAAHWSKLMTNQPTSNITLQNSCYEFGEEVIRIDKQGFHYRGQFIADAGEAHRLMVEFLRQSTKPEPQGPTLAEVDDLCAEHNFMYDGGDEGLECVYALIVDALALWGNQ